MNASRLIAAAVIAGLSGAALAASPPTKETIEKTALTAHPGTVLLSKQEKKSGKDVWEVMVKGTDGKDYTMFFDPKTGSEVKL